LLAPLPDAITSLTPNPERMSGTLTLDLLAVELADALVAQGVPFRDAHAVVGKLWYAAEQRSVTPAGVPLADRLAISPHFTDALLAGLSVEKALDRRNHTPGAGPESVALQLQRAEARLGLGPGDPESSSGGGGSRGGSKSARANGSGKAEDDITVRRATLADVTGIASLMANHVADGTLLPRPVSELYQCIREFFVAEHHGDIVGCAALRLLWQDMGEVRSLVVREDYAGKGIGLRLVDAVLDAGRAVGVPRVIALTREVGFFERAGFTVASRERLPRKVWTDCVRCPKRHACDETAVVIDLVPGATEAAERTGPSHVLPIPLVAEPGGFVELPIVAN